MLRCVCLCFLIWVLGCSRSQAQTPFETLTIEAGATANVFAEKLHTRWSPGRGGTVTVQTPFYRGIATLGLHGQQYQAAADVPAFTGLVAYVGWGPVLRIGSRVSWQLSARVGNHRMSFDEDTFAGVSTESELMMGLSTQAALALGRRLQVFARVAYEHTFTERPLRLVHASAGLGWTLRTPPWLQRILR